MKPLKLTSFSDCHLGTNRLSAEEMCSSLKSLVFPLVEKSDIVVLSGDLFDSAIGLSDKPVMVIIGFLIEFLTLCQEKNITVRIIRGTFSHDRTQPSILPTLHRNYKFTNDLKYYDKISLEYIEKYDAKFLFIPDDPPFNSSEEVMSFVKDMMDEVGWTYVDMAYVHSYFQHVLPEQSLSRPKIVYRDDQFSFVKYFTCVGHVHQHSVYNNIMYNGSTDRIAHGEEDPKGCLYITFDGSHYRAKFIENKEAAIFKTFDYSNIDQDNLINQFEKDIKKYPSHRTSHVRIQHPNPEVKKILYGVVREKYPHIKFSYKPSSKEQENDSHTASIGEDIVILTPPTPETLPDTILDCLNQYRHPIILERDRIVQLLQKPIR